MIIGLKRHRNEIDFSFIFVLAFIKYVLHKYLEGIQMLMLTKTRFNLWFPMFKLEEKLLTAMLFEGFSPTGELIVFESSLLFSSW